MTDTRPDIPVVVLAAGASSRMRGADKLLEIVDGRPLLRRQVETAQAATSGAVLVALPPRPHPRYDVLRGLDIVAVPVAEAAEGMNASLRTAFAVLPRGAPAAMLLLGDLPDLTENDLRTVMQAVDPASDILVWRGMTAGGEPGHPVVFAAPLFAHFASLRGDGGGREVVAMAGDKVRLVALPGQHARNDLDTPEDWAAWRAAAGREPETD